MPPAARTEFCTESKLEHPSAKIFDSGLVLSKANAEGNMERGSDIPNFFQQDMKSENHPRHGRPHAQIRRYHGTIVPTAIRPNANSLFLLLAHHLAWIQTLWFKQTEGTTLHVKGKSYENRGP